MKSNIFKKAHELTKKIIMKGDNYRATFKLCLSFVYSQIKKSTKSIEEILKSKGYKVWDKYGYRRIYLNDAELLANQFGVELTSTRVAKKVSMYYDCKDDTFYFSTTGSRKDFVQNLIKAIRNNL